VKALVFSWKDFEQGYRFDSDNRNLGLHEFAHAAYFHLKAGTKSIIFSSTYVKIQEYLVQPNILNQLDASGFMPIRIRWVF
jgi:hypothetical protein